MHVRPMGGAPAPDPVDHVDGVAAAHEILRPAFTPVRRAGEVGAGLAAAVHHHDRRAMALPLRDHVFDIDVADRRGAFDCRIELAADEEVARLREHKRPLLCACADGCGERLAASAAPHSQRPRAVHANPFMRPPVAFLFHASGSNRSPYLGARYSRSPENRDGRRRYEAVGGDTVERAPARRARRRGSTSKMSPASGRGPDRREMHDVAPDQQALVAGMDQPAGMAGRMAGQRIATRRESHRRRTPSACDRDRARGTPLGDVAADALVLTGWNRG